MSGLQLPPTLKLGVCRRACHSFRSRVLRFAMTTRPDKDVIRERIAASRAKLQAAAERNRQKAAEPKRFREEAVAAAAG